MEGTYPVVASGAGPAAQATLGGRRGLARPVGQKPPSLRLLTWPPLVVSALTPRWANLTANAPHAANAH